MTRFVIAALVASLFGAMGATAHAQDAPVTSEPRVLASTTLWKKDAYEVKGLISIVERDGQRTLTLSRDFSTRAGPDLKLVLSPLTIDKVRAKTALQGSRVIAPLKSETGAQTYTIPSDVELERYKSILIHCEKYTKLWGGVALRKGEVVGVGDAWTKKTKRTKGRFEIVRVGQGGDARYEIRFGPAFSTSKAPEPLRVVFSPMTSSQAKDENAMRGGTLVANTGTYKGAQVIRVPQGIDPTSSKSLLLHCEKYTKLWSAGDIRWIQ